MIGKYNKSVILTYLGVCLSITGMGLAIHNNISWAMICLIFAGICDLFDGVIARRCKRTEEEKQFGVQIDSLADMISFVAFPVVTGLFMLDNLGLICLPVLAVYALCGVIRLAWFNMTTNSEGNKEYYAGLPVTYCAMIFPILWLLNYYISSFAFSLITAFVYLVVALLYILNIKIKKPTGIWYVFFSLLAITVTTLIILKETL